MPRARPPESSNPLKVFLINRSASPRTSFIYTRSLVACSPFSGHSHRSRNRRKIRRHRNVWGFFSRPRISINTRRPDAAAGLPELLVFALKLEMFVKNVNDTLTRNKYISAMHVVAWALGYNFWATKYLLANFRIITAASSTWYK